MDRYIFEKDHDPGQDVRLHLKLLDVRVEKALERGSIHLLQERVRIHIQLMQPTPMGRTMNNIMMIIGKMNKLGMMMKPTLVFLVDLKKNNIIQLVRMSMSTSMMLMNLKQWH